MLRACRAATLIVPPGAVLQTVLGIPKTAQGREGVPGKPGSADSCQPPLAALFWIIGTATPCENPFAAQLGSAPGGLQKYPGSAFWFPVVKKKVRLLRSKKIPEPARITVLASGE